LRCKQSPDPLSHQGVIIDYHYFNFFAVRQS
jgi:hypothetical protein